VAAELTPAEQRVIEEVAGLEPFLVDLTAQLVRIPSVSPALQEASAADGGEARVNGVVREVMIDSGLDVTSVEAEPGRLNVIGTLPGTGGGPSLGFNGHIDTVPALPEQGWDDDPWSGAVRDGRLWGRGSTDMKGGVAAMVVATAAIARAGVRLRGDVMLQSVCGEEMAEPAGTRAVLQAGFRPDACVNTEPSMDRLSGELAIHPMSNGAILLRVTLSGKATHSALRQEWLYPGGRPFVGVNSLEKGVDLVKAVQELERSWAFTKRHPLFPPGKFIIHPGYFHSGPPGGGSGPHFPTETCIIEWIIYHHPHEPAEVTKREIEQYIMDWAARDPWLRDHPPTVDFYLELANFATDPAHPLVATVGAAYQDVTGRAAPVSGFLAGSDATFLCANGIPTVIHGPGEVSVAHMTNEYVDIEQLHRAARTYALAAMRWCQAEP
jgi:acetylornithine deacetylase/succinyl-diaminopimelate desuccinylase family protein